MLAGDAPNKKKPWLDRQFHDVEKTRIKKPDELGITERDYALLNNSTGDIADKIQGSMFGLALGDALGAPVEFRPNSFLAANPVVDLMGGGTWGLQKGQFTDDTSMALCLANSLVACRNFVPYDQLVRYKWWYRDGYMSSTGQCFDIGSATRKSIQKFEQRQKQFALDHGITLDQMDYLSDPDLLQAFDVNCSETGVAGNGALMRLAPVPLFFFRQPEVAVECSGISGKITHGDEKAHDACCYYGALIVAALRGETKEQLVSNTFYEEHIGWFKGRVLHDEIMKIAKGSYKKDGGYKDGILGKGYVVNALEAALWAFWSDRNSFREGALKAVNLGDDADTTAAIYGQLAGAHYGYKNLPHDWLKYIYGKSFVECVSSWLVSEGDEWFQNIISQATDEPINPHHSKSSNQTPSKPIVPAIEFLSMESISSSLGTGSNVMTRKAIDPSGKIGHIYDACEDRVLGPSNIDFELDRKFFPPRIDCEMKRGDQIENRNLLRLCGFDSEQRLNVLCKLAQAERLARAINYPFEIDEFTRIFYYSNHQRSQTFPSEINIRAQTKINHGTHIITGIEVGVDVIAVLIVRPNAIEMMDVTFSRVCHSMKERKQVLLEKHADDNIVSTFIYSNMDQLAKQKTFQQLCSEIHLLQNQNYNQYPCKYFLRPIDMFYSNRNQHAIVYVPIEPSISTKVEEHLLRLGLVTQMWERFEQMNASEILKTDLHRPYGEAKRKFLKLYEEYSKGYEQIRGLLIAIRSGTKEPMSLQKSLGIEMKETMLKREIDEFKHDLKELKRKRFFFEDLKTKGFQFWNAANLDLDIRDGDDALQRKLVKSNEQRILCSDDNLNKIDKSHLDEIIKRLLEERQQNGRLQLIYVDFSYTKHKLNEIKTYPVVKYNLNTSSRDLLTSTPTTPDVDPESDDLNNQTINIILIGKSGVGKSTFINVIANYLKYNAFSSFDPRVSEMLIKIPFYIEVPCWVESHCIQIGVSDSNEDALCSGQTRTQRCKSHIFNLEYGQKLCIVDTPGFSHGVNKYMEDINRSHVLSYVSSFTHLNAICVLIESGKYEPSLYTRYLKQLIYFIGEGAQNKLIFCFTKSLVNRISDSERLERIRDLYKQLNINGMSTDLKNVIHVDNDFLSYFATKNIFHNEQGNSKESLTMTKKGIDELIRFIRGGNCTPYFLHQGLQAAEFLKIKVLDMVRPITESLRNIFRNKILLKSGRARSFVVLCPKPIYHSAWICCQCQRASRRFGEFWILDDSLHEGQAECLNCYCDMKQHIHVDYVLRYWLTDRSWFDSNKQNALEEGLFEASVRFAHFLLDIVKDTKDDPFLAAFIRMINEESYICDTKSNSEFNLQLYNEIIHLKIDYERELKKMREGRLHNDLFAVKRCVDRVKNYRMVNAQIQAAKGTREASIIAYICRNDALARDVYLFSN